MLQSHTYIYEMRIELLDFKPLIWRSFRIPANATLADLHVAIQVVMGWSNSHLHEFRIGKNRYGQPYPDGIDIGPTLLDERGHTLKQVLTRPKMSIAYTYDFGDGWEHILTLIDIHADEPALACIDGERAGPPDDCGGPHGFAHLLSVIANRKHPEHRSAKRWLAEMTPKGYDPTVFDRAAANEILANGLAGLRDRYVELADEDEDDDGKIIKIPPRME